MPIPEIEVIESDLVQVLALSRLQLIDENPGVILIKKSGPFWVGYVEQFREAPCSTACDYQALAERKGV